MLNNTQRKKIFNLYYKEGYSKRGISRKMEIHRNTVTEYINRFKDISNQLNINPKYATEREIEEIIKKIRYNLGKREEKIKITPELLKVIKQFKDDNGHLKPKEVYDYVRPSNNFIKKGKDVESIKIKISEDEKLNPKDFQSYRNFKAAEMIQKTNSKYEKKHISYNTVYKAIQIIKEKYNIEN